MNENNYWLPAGTVVGQRYKIEKVLPNGELILQDTRYQGGIEEDA